MLTVSDFRRVIVWRQRHDAGRTPEGPRDALLDPLGSPIPGRQSLR